MRRQFTSALAGVAMLLVACGSDSGSSGGTAVTSAPSTAAPTTVAATASTAPVESSTAPPESSTSVPAVQPLDPPVKVTFGVAGTLGEAGLYIAADRGYFKDEGLDVNLVASRKFSDALPLLATGQMDFATGGPNPDLWNAIKTDIPVKIVAAHATGAPGTAQSALVVSQKHFDDGSYKELKDLKGMKIGINSLGSSSEFYIEKMLEKGGLTEADVQLVVMGFADMAAAMTNGGIDAAFTVEPNITNMVKTGLGQTVLTTTDAIPGSIASLIVISPVFAKDHADAADRVMYAFLKAQREYLDAFINGKNPDGRAAIIDILTQHTAVKDPALFQDMGMSGGDPTGKFDLSSLADFQAFFLSKGSIDTELDPKDMVDFSYLDYANQRLDQEGGS